MRGKNKFLETFREEGNDDRQQKGRSRNLVALRNQCLIARYYYYGAFTDKRYDIIVELIAAEFFLSVQTIPGILKTNTAELRALKTKQPPLSYFQQRWPHIKW